MNTEKQKEIHAGKTLEELWEKAMCGYHILKFENKKYYRFNSVEVSPSNIWRVVDSYIVNLSIEDVCPIPEDTEPWIECNQDGSPIAPEPVCPIQQMHDWLIDAKNTASDFDIPNEVWSPFAEAVEGLKFMREAE